MRSSPLVLFILAAALSGCAEETPSQEPTTDTDQEGSEPSGQDEGTPDVEDVANNTAPSADLTADALNGTAPLLLNLTIDGSDADGDDLTWFLMHKGTEAANGTSLPHVLSLNLTAGNHTFALTVSDGNATGNASLTVTVPAAEGADDAPVDMGSFIYDPATGMCHLKEYDAYGAGPAMVYNFAFWVFAETNGEPGLQVANNFLVPAAEGAGFADPAWDICEDGDQMVF